MLDLKYIKTLSSNQLVNIFFHILRVANKTETEDLFQHLNKVTDSSVFNKTFLFDLYVTALEYHNNDLLLYLLNNHPYNCKLSLKNEQLISSALYYDNIEGIDLLEKHTGLLTLVINNHIYSKKEFHSDLKIFGVVKEKNSKLNIKDLIKKMMCDEMDGTFLIMLDLLEKPNEKFIKSILCIAILHDNEFVINLILKNEKFVKQIGSLDFKNFFSVLTDEEALLQSRLGSYLPEKKEKYRYIIDKIQLSNDLSILSLPTGRKIKV